MPANRVAKTHKLKDPTIQIVTRTTFKIRNSGHIRAVGLLLVYAANLKLRVNYGVLLTV